MRCLKRLILSVSCMWILFFQLSAQNIKRLYIANDDHTDYMWKGNEAAYDSAFLHMLDFHLQQLDSTRDLPFDFQDRFNCDGSYWIRTYQKYRTPNQFEHLLQAIQSGHISCPLTEMVSTYGAQPTEAVLRGMFYAGYLEREYHLRLTMAVAMENQTLPMGLSSLWAGSGAKFSWRGVCGCASRIFPPQSSDNRNPLYYYTGPDNQSVIMKWYPRGNNNMMPGGYAETRLTNIPADPVKALDTVINILDKMCNTQAYPYSASGAFGYGWDDLDTYTSRSFREAAKNNSNGYRKVRISNEQDFFQDILNHYSGQLPKEKVSYGNEWDLYCASMNETTSKVRRATEKLRSAEAMFCLVSLKNSAFAKNITAIRDLAWEGFGKYWEHNWTADGPVSRTERAAWQNQVQKEISQYVDTLFEIASEALGRLIQKGKYPRVYVFNPLGWKRSDVADIFYENTHSPIRVIDLRNGREVPSQRVLLVGKSYIRIWADNIPSVGYVIYEVRAGRPKIFSSVLQYKNGYLENNHFRIRFTNAGVISEIYDLKSGKRQLVQNQPGKYLNNLGSTNLQDGKMMLENTGSVSFTLKTISDNPIAHSVRLTLYNYNARISIDDSILANFKDLKSWAFSTTLRNQTTRHEELGAILRVRKQKQGGDYANQNARYDWQTFNHFADLSNGNFGITISNQDCSFFKLGESRPDSLCENSPNIYALAGGRVDHMNPAENSFSDLGIFNQNDEIRFQYHFALTTHNNGFHPVNAMRFAMEDQNHFVTGKVSGKKKIYSSIQFSLIQSSNPKVLLWALKPCEAGIDSGIVARYWNLSAWPAVSTIQCKRTIFSAYQTTHLEIDENSILTKGNSIKIHYAPFQIKTYRMKLK